MHQEKVVQEGMPSGVEVEALRAGEQRDEPRLPSKTLKRFAVTGVWASSVEFRATVDATDEEDAIERVRSCEWIEWKENELSIEGEMSDMEAEEVKA